MCAKESRAAWSKAQVEVEPGAESRLDGAMDTFPDLGSLSDEELKELIRS